MTFSSLLLCVHLRAQNKTIMAIKSMGTLMRMVAAVTGAVNTMIIIMINQMTRMVNVAANAVEAER